MQNRVITAIVAAVVLVVGTAWFAMRPAGVADAAAPDWDTAPVRLLIDVSERKLYVEEDGEVVRSYDVAVGQQGHPTPRGSFSVSRVIWNPRWVPPKSEWAEGKQPKEPGDPANPMGRVKIFFKQPDYYIHGTNDAKSIGSAASHGCVRMLNDDVISLARLLVEKGDAPVEPGLIQRLINRVKQTKEMRLSQAIPLRVRT